MEDINKLIEYMKAYNHEKAKILTNLKEVAEPKFNEELYKIE